MTTYEERFEQYLDRILQRPLPADAMARLLLLARELAEGALAGLWWANTIWHNGLAGLHMGGKIENRETLAHKYGLDLQSDTVGILYQKIRWQDDPPLIGNLVSMGYLTMEGAEHYCLTRAAFDLITEPTAEHIFISYRRKDSSAFALLILARLKAAGIDAFLDMTIQPGDNWRDHIRDEVQQRRFLILLLGHDSLNSEVIQEEITWALDAGLTILPIWHNGFTFQPDNWPALPERIRVMLGTTHTIRVLEESALAYNNAIIELLNRFGVTP